MYTRQNVWQDATVQSKAKNEWENIIVMGSPCVDFRVRLRGYGWKPSSSDVNLTVLYEGRYACYYRERYSSTWIKFATVVSERASHVEDKVYEDTYVTLGVVASKIYEIKIVALDGERFDSWGGEVEGIEFGGEFWYSAKARGARPYKVQVSESLVASEVLNVGKSVLDIDIYEDIISGELPPQVINQWEIVPAETSSIEDTAYMQLAIALDIADYVNVSLDFNAWRDAVNLYLALDEVIIQEATGFLIYPMGITPLEYPTIEEWTTMSFDPMGVVVTEVPLVEEWIKLSATPPVETYEMTPVNEYVEMVIEPPWRIIVPNFGAHEYRIWVNDFAQLVVQNSLFYDSCDSLSNWLDESWGAGAVIVDTDHFELTSPDTDSTAMTSRDTGIDFGSYYSFGFKFQNQNVSAGYSGSRLAVSVGSEKRSMTVFVTPTSDSEGTISFVEGTTVFENVPMVKGEWQNIRIDVLEEAVIGLQFGCLVDVVVDDVFVGRTFAGYDFDYITLNGNIKLTGDVVGTYGCAFGVDEINVNDLRSADYLEMWKRDNLYSGSDISVGESVAYELTSEGDKYTRIDEEILVEENVSMLMEGGEINVHSGVQIIESRWVGMSLMELFALDELLVTDYALYESYTGLQVSDSISIVEAIIMHDIIIELYVYQDINAYEGFIDLILVSWGEIFIGEVVSVGEWTLMSLPSIEVDTTVSVSEDANVVTLAVPPNAINKSESIGVAEFVQMLDIGVEMSAYDTIEIVESVVIGLSIISMFVEEGVSVAENVSAGVTTVQPNEVDVFDGIAVTENVQTHDLVIELGVVSDIVSVAESVALILDAVLFVQENVSAVEDAVADVLAVPPNEVNVYGEIGIVEYIQMHDIGISVDVADGIGNLENISVNVAIVPVNEITVLDDISVVENRSVFLPTLIVSVDENINVMEYIEILSPNLDIFKWEEISIVDEEIIEVLPAPDIDNSIFDTVNIVEVIYMHDIIIDTLLYENISVLENVMLVPEILFVSAYDELVINEWESTVMKADISIDENIAIEENIDILVYYFEPGDINVYENIAVEDVWILLPFNIEGQGVVALLHFDGTDGTQIATDDSYYIHGYTFVDDGGQELELDSARKKFGTTSLIVPQRLGNSPYMQIDPNNGELDLGDKDFFVEFRWYRTNAWSSGIYHLFGNYHIGDGSDPSIIINANNPSLPKMVFDSQTAFGATGLEHVMSATEYALDTWHTVAISRKGNQYFLFLDGKLVANKQGVDEISMPDAVAWRIGALGTSNIFDGWIDEFYAVIGHHVHDNDYVVRVEAYTDPTILNEWIDIAEYVEPRILSVRDIFVIDNVGIEEIVSHFFPTLSLLAIDNDIVVVNEYFDGNTDPLFLDIFDAISIVENILGDIPIPEIDVFDEASVVSESFDALLFPMAIVVNETITVAEDFQYDWYTECQDWWNPAYTWKTVGTGNTMEYNNPAGTFHILVPNSSTSDCHLYFRDRIDPARVDGMLWMHEIWEIEFRMKFTSASTDKNFFKLYIHNKDMYQALSFKNGDIINSNNINSIVGAWTADDAWHAWKFRYIVSGSGINAILVIQVWKDDILIGEILDTPGTPTKTGHDTEIEFRTDYGNDDNEWYMDWIKLVRLQDDNDPTINLIVVDPKLNFPDDFIEATENINIQVV